MHHFDRTNAKPLFLTQGPLWSGADGIVTPKTCVGKFAQTPPKSVGKFAQVENRRNFPHRLFPHASFPTPVGLF